VLTAVTAVNSTSVNVQWKMPTELNGVLASYTIVYNTELDPEKIISVLFNGELVSSMYIAKGYTYEIFRHNLTSLLDYFPTN